MHKNIVSLLVFLSAAVALFTVSSCDTGGDHHPTICFRLTTDSISYESSYLSLPRDTTFNVYVQASKTGPDGTLKSFKVTKSINGGADSTLIDATLSTIYFAHYYTYKAGDSGDVEKYNFTIGNDEGLFKSIEFVDTVK